MQISSLSSTFYQRTTYNVFISISIRFTFIYFLVYLSFSCISIYLFIHFNFYCLSNFSSPRFIETTRFRKINIYRLVVIVVVEIEHISSAIRVRRQQRSIESIEYLLHKYLADHNRIEKCLV